MMGRVSGPAQIVAVIVLGVGGAIFYMQKSAANPPLDVGTQNVEADFRAMHASDSDEELRAERTRLHEAIAREIAAVASERVAREDHTPGAADAPPTEWGDDELTVRMEAGGNPVLVVIQRNEAPDVFRLHDKHRWITGILTTRGVATE